MVEHMHQRHWQRDQGRSPLAWIALGVAGLILLPVLSVLVIATGGDGAAFAHLSETVLPRYLGNTAALMLQVGALAGAIGAGGAWLTVMYDFPGRRMLDVALFLPLAVPAFVGAYALADFLEYAGPVQTALRELFGWQTARDYWFPEVRSRGMATIVLAAALYPYTYLFVRAALREQGGALYATSRTLGVGGWKQFLRLGLPLCRPAAAVGVAIAMMETVADFGTVDHFSVQTLTTGIFTTWLEARDAGGAARIAVLVLLIVLGLIGLERHSRRRARFFAGRSHGTAAMRERLTGWRAWAATFACTLPPAVGFVLPLLVLAQQAQGAVPRGFMAALGNTVLTSSAAALITVALATLTVAGVRVAGRKVAAAILPATMIGYAAPGAVLGLGIMIPLGIFDNALADFVEGLTGIDIGLLLTGTAVAIVLGYTVRFFALAQGAADTALGRLSPNLGHAARTLGQGRWGALARVELPLMRRSLGLAMLLVFIDAAKELPLTLLLRPFGFDTLATLAHEQASLENIAGAAGPAVVMIALGTVAVAVVARATR